MQETMFPAIRSLHTIKLLLITLLCLTGWLWPSAVSVSAAPQRRAGAQRHARHGRRSLRRRAVRAVPARAERFDEASARGEVESEGGEEVERREDWFLFQRSYPYSTPPANARRAAWAERRRGKGDADDLWPFAAATSLATWRAIGPAPTNSAFISNWGQTSGRINSIAISPADPQLVLVGASTGGIWRSTDGGTNFTAVSDTQVDISVGAIAFSRSNPAIVYAGMGDLYNGYLGTGVLKSADGGQTWTRVSNSTLPAPGTTVKLEVDPTNPNRVYLLQYQSYDGNANNILAPSGVFISTDGGVNWTRTFAGLVRDIAIKPNDPNTIYIGVRRADDPITGAINISLPGLYKSIDGGNTWVIAYPSTFGAYTSSTRIDMRIGVTPAAPDTLYLFTGNTINPSAAQLFIIACTDTGVVACAPRNSTGIDSGQFGYNAYIAVDPANASTLYVGTRDVYKSTNGGQSWTSLTNNFTFNAPSSFSYNPFNSRSHPDQHSFAFAPNDPNTIYIGNDGGIWKSANGGATLQSLNATLALSQFIGIAMHPTDATRTYGGTQDNGTQFRAPTGNGWQEFAEGDGGYPVVNAPDPSIVFSTYIYGSIRWWRFNADGSRTELSSRRTSNATFGEPSSSPRISFYAPFTTNGVDSTVYFGTWRLFLSSTYADSAGALGWTAPGGLTDLTKGGTDVLTAIGVEHKANAQVIYTGSAQGRVMVTINAGQTWTDITAGLPNRYISAITVDPLNAAIAYLTVSGYGSGHVFKTSNQGQTWTDLSGVAPTGLPNVPAGDILPDPLTPTTLYVATDIGVYRSLTGGTVWESFNQGLPPVVVSDITMNASGQIQIGTYGRGAYELTTSGSGPASVQFSAPVYTFSEGAVAATINVTRTGDAAAAASVDFATMDDPAEVPCASVSSVAYARCDYATSIETVTFAAGETQKSVTIPLIDDAHVESSETVQLNLQNAVGATLGSQSTATLTITDNDTPGQANPIFSSPFFVRQQYLDFLSREPDTGGYNGWLNLLNSCQNVNNTDTNSPSVGCDRINVSYSFFGSQEFQLKGYFVYRFYKLAFNRLPQYVEIIPDMRGVTGQTAAEVFAKKAAFTNSFVQRTEFVNAYGALSNTDFVNALMNRYSLSMITTPDPAQPDGTTKVTFTSATLIGGLTAGTLTRPQVLRAIADSDQDFNAEFNQAFVAMQYYGYLRRTPEPGGYQSWLNYLMAHPTDARTMVNGFMNSQEYRLRFGQP